MTFDVCYVEIDGSYNKSIVEADNMSDAIAFVESKPNCVRVDACTTREDWSKYYVNCSTGEAVIDKEVAMSWYRNGVSVEVWKNGRRIITMNELFAMCVS